MGNLWLVSLLYMRWQSSYALKMDFNVKVSNWYSASGGNSWSLYMKLWTKYSVPFHYPIPTQVQSTHRSSRYISSTYLKWKSFFEKLYSYICTMSVIPCYNHWKKKKKVNINLNSFHSFHFQRREGEKVAVSLNTQHKMILVIFPWNMHIGFSYYSSNILYQRTCSLPENFFIKASNGVMLTAEY